MTAKRGDNAGNHKGIVGRVDAIFEMECFEQLGPMARQAIVESPLKVLAAPIVIDIRKFEEELREKKKDPELVLDLQSPRLDASVANGIRSDSLRVVCIDRNEQDARDGMRPLRPLRPARHGRRIYR